LIRAIHQMAGQSLDVMLLLIGEGDARPRLEHLIQELNCGERVRLLGYQNDPRSLYGAMDTFALTSLRGGLPNVLLEAMALEVPVVATRIAGVPRLITHEESGLLVEPGSLKELADGLMRLYNDRALADKLAHAGRQTIDSRYSFQVRMGRIRNLYDELL